MSTELDMMANMYAALDAAMYAEHPRANSLPNMRDCQHGRLARKCELCERNRHIAELTETLRSVMRCARCPRPFSGRPDDWTADQCNDAKECGCVYRRAREALLP